MIQVVYAMSRALVPLVDGTRALVAKGSHWPAEDPVVLAQPSLFSPDPRWGLMYSVEPAGYGAPMSGVVEAASATPGEKRTTRRG